MSIDVFFQGFNNGDARDCGSNEMKRVLAPLSTAGLVDPSYFEVICGDGRADIYLSESACLANEISGNDPWDLLIQAARAANWVIMPIGCPVCMTAEDQRSDLTEELQQDLVLVTAGKELEDHTRNA